MTIDWFTLFFDLNNVIEKVIGPLYQYRGFSNRRIKYEGYQRIRNFAYHKAQIFKVLFLAECQISIWWCGLQLSQISWSCRWDDLMKFCPWQFKRNKYSICISCRLWHPSLIVKNRWYLTYHDFIFKEFDSGNR